MCISKKKNTVSHKFFFLGINFNVNKKKKKSNNNLANNNLANNDNYFFGIKYLKEKEKLVK